MNAITVVAARWARGYSHVDHLLRDDDMRAVAGRTYPTLRAAALACARAAGPQARGVYVTRAALTYYLTGAPDTERTDMVTLP